jgi:carbon storage regulator
MLVLTRKLGEAVVIDGLIRVTVVRIMGDSVRLGIAAPQEIPVHRAEVQAAIDRGDKPGREGRDG